MSWFLKYVFLTLITLFPEISINPKVNQEAYFNRLYKNLNKQNFAINNINPLTKNFSLLFVGDIILAVGTDRIIKEKGTKFPFKKVKNFLKSADLTIANLEAPITDKGRRVKNKLWTFRTKPDYAKLLSENGIDMVSIANNHILDFGKDGLFDTINNLNKLNICFVGAGKDLKTARKPVIKSIFGTEIVFLAYCQRGPSSFYAKENRLGNAFYDVEMIIEDVKKYKKQDNIVIPMFHWGIEITNSPQKFQIEDSQKIIEAGADAIIGHHPHVPQGIQIYKNKPIVYSLGNFLVGFYNPKYSSNIAVKLVYSKNQLEKLKIFPISGKNEIIQYQPSIEKDAEAQKTLKHIQKISLNWETTILIKNDIGLIYPQNECYYAMKWLKTIWYFLKHSFLKILPANHFPFQREILLLLSV